jgi:hypothetical protein
MIVLLAALLAAPETHSFKVHAEVQYRCYGGTGAQKASDTRTHVVCDDQTERKVLVDEVIRIQIRNEPNPDDAKDLEGSWGRTFEYKGRKLQIAVDLFKTVPAKGPRPYELRLVADDDEPGTRMSSTLAQAEKTSAFNKLTIDYSSRGQPEEITYRVSIEPAQ